MFFSLFEPVAHAEFIMNINVRQVKNSIKVAKWGNRVMRDLPKQAATRLRVLIMPSASSLRANTSRKCDVRM